MRILLAAKHPPGGKLPIGGVQSWIETVAGELVRLGHTVAIWGPEWPLPGGEFDLGILANTRYTGAALGRCRRTLVISHGVIPDEEPVGGDAQAFTSEGVREHWGGQGAVIGQPIDLGFWTPGSAPRGYLTRHSYRAGLEFLPALAAFRGLGFQHLRTEMPAAVRSVLQRSQVVVATGRAALEAMACGASVVIADDRPYQGPLLDPDAIGSRARNYSGRGGITPTAENMNQAIEAALQAGSLRHHVAEHHDARQVVQELLCCIC